MRNSLVPASISKRADAECSASVSHRNSTLAARGGGYVIDAFRDAPEEEAYVQPQMLLALLLRQRLATFSNMSLANMCCLK